MNNDNNVTDGRDLSGAKPIPVSVTDLQKIKLFVGLPMYGGTCFGFTAKALIEMGNFFTAHGIEYKTHYLFNESLIQRARNYVVDEFLRSDCTHLLFIDADVGFDYDAVLTLMTFATKHPDCGDVVSAVYPRKTIAWEKVSMAVEKGLVEDPNDLSNYASDYVFNFKEGTESFDLFKPLEVSETGTGFMMISRHVFEKFENAYPEYRYTPDHIRSDTFDGSHKITAYFHCEIDPVSNRYLSEDYFFCRKVSALGMKVMVLPWVNLSHTGTYTHKSSIVLMAQNGLPLVSGGYKKKGG